MILTPTYYVFQLYKEHQNNMLLDSYIETSVIGDETNQVPNLQESASEDSEGNIHVTINNLSLDEAYELELDTIDKSVTGVKAEILSGDMNACNTLEQPDKIQIQEFKDFTIKNGKVYLVLPPCSVIHVVLR